ncbi:hypothetical protein EDL79_01520 [Ehrlichia ruminantium]|uniref:Uncharacterized protein n=1 Tax=Ehrlichia ruminantium TaxID=779 RepID=A0AAE6QCW7_EHRRU|nr:hypothetical protein [Ehrlichia ruminantium]QGR02356.1 hypothetical protein EDL81_01525 [Ehrlichia ruminantium]QGR03275.1 hypothetical protein EDL80_01520 [Ehrlichia ruminantium]QGR04200.1 hypothetical protein EDL79_01520 [Ehrlichia ruminantium]
MNKIESNIAFATSSLLLISTIVIPILLRQYLKSILFCIPFFIAFITSGILFICTLLDRIYVSRGIKLKYKSKHKTLDINFNEKAGIFISLPLSYLPRIDRHCNILEYHIILSGHKTHEEQYLIKYSSIEQNQGPYNMLDFKTLSNNGIAKLITDEHTLNTITNNQNLAGLLIITNKSTIASLPTKTGPNMYFLHLILNHDYTLSISSTCVADKCDKAIQHNPTDLDIFLKNRHKNSKITVYDIAVKNLLTRHGNVLDHPDWFNTQDGKIIIEFFRTFNTQQYIRCFESFICAKKYIRKIKIVEEYIKNNTIDQPTDEEIMDYITNIILEVYSSFFDYSELYMNRYICTPFQSTLNLMYYHVGIGLYRYIYTLAILENYDTHHQYRKTNAAIHNLLVIREKANIEPIISYFKTNKTIKRTTKFENKVISRLLTTVLDDDDKEYTIAELIAHARKYISTICTNMLLYYNQKVESFNTAKVDSIILLAPEKKKIHDILENASTSTPCTDVKQTA